MQPEGGNPLSGVHLASFEARASSKHPVEIDWLEIDVTRGGGYPDKPRSTHLPVAPLRSMYRSLKSQRTVRSGFW